MPVLEDLYITADRWALDLRVSAVRFWGWEENVRRDFFNLQDKR